MEVYKWDTIKPHQDNEETMLDFLDNHFLEVFDSECKVVFLDGTYAEVTTSANAKYELHASGDGDFLNHKLEYEMITTLKQ